VVLRWRARARLQSTIVVAMGLVLAGCGAAATAARPVTHTTTTTTAVSAAASAPGYDAPAIAPPPAGSVYVATATVPSLPIYSTPRALGPDESISNPNPLGAPLTLLVNAMQGGWLQVYLPQRPNESTGWVSQNDVTLATDAEHIVVSLGARQVTLYDNGAKVYQASVAAGAPDSPTPMGHFFVTEVLKLTDPGDAYGPYALGLSGFSNTYYAFDGGPGQIAIHGTNQPWVIGGYASHGCVRLSNPDITTLATQVPAGTPVDIVA
jgi:lipoprotein-anchoring transpeptidase ErfK/SrfK